MVLQNPRVDFAVFEVARGGILREGLGYEHNDVAVVLNVQPDHLGLRGIDTVEQLADVKAVLVEAVPRGGHAVLNADDPLVRAMRRKCSGQVVWFSMAQRDTPEGAEVRDLIDTHCRRGGKALVLEPTERGEMIVVRHGRRDMQLAWTHLLPSTFAGRARMNVQNALAAAHFDVVIVREDESLRGRERGDTAALVTEGVRTAMTAGARCKQVETIIDEIGAVRHAMARANRGDLVVVCVDKHPAVMAELENWSQQAHPGASTHPDAPVADPDYSPPVAETSSDDT
jgi:UDP-N-acetylmuramyl tripeptide synthase